MALQGVVGAFQYKNKQKDTQDTDVVKHLQRKYARQTDKQRSWLEISWQSS